MENKQNILSKIQDRTITVGIIGLGYVGLPLAVAFALEKVKVIGFDLSAEKVARVNNAQNYISDVQNADLQKVVSGKYLKATVNFSELNSCDAIIICVPTPLDRFKKPDMTYIETACVAIGKNMKPGTFVSLESTTYPTTTEDFVLPILGNE
ncbi:MAG TPA: NAD(P)-binding domain-containing protein, partial [Prolixibacteraceae bacterium]|nr:NAD(P)-binding domain-containing protein [Prolixibacteraceae bacterium]